MAADIENIRAGDYRLLIDPTAFIKTVDGVREVRSMIFPYALIRAKGEADFAYMVPTGSLFSDIFVGAHGTGGPEQAEFAYPAVQLSFETFKRVEPESDEDGPVRVHFYPGV